MKIFSRLAAATRLCAGSFLLLAVLGCVVSCSHKRPQSRYIFMPPIDDGGQSSGPHAVSICVPAGYDSTDRRYPVIYVLDGEVSFLTKENGMRDTTAYELAHDQLVHEGLIEPAIFVAIHNSVDAKGEHIKDNRFLDYSITGQTNKLGKVETTKSEGYYQYLAKTIKPMIDKTYRTRPEAASTGVAGFSAGGASAFWMTYMHPETFGMGICQSPPFWTPYVGKEFKAIMEDPKRPIPPVRLWIDAGSREYKFIYKAAYETYAKLIARGFRENDNLAFYTGHDHGHEKFDCNRRLRAGLYFMLRTKTPTLTGVQITEIDAVEGGPIKLAQRGHAVLEATYDNWFTITDCTATFTIGDPTVVSLKEGSNELRPLAAGHTTITSSYAGREVVQQVEVLPPESPLACKAMTVPVVIDGDLSEWQGMLSKVEAPLSDTDAPAWKGPADLSYRLAYGHDDEFLYVAIETTDDYINSVEKKDPWVQDGVEVRIDARPPAARIAARAPKEGVDILMVAMSPAKAGETRLPYKAVELPDGVQAVCKATATGHITEMAIPFTYLDEMADQPWTDVRVNIVVNDLDKDPSDFKGDKLWWRADWRGARNAWGSGTLQRQ